MTPSPAQLAALEAAAAAWVGTPFCESSRIRGAGVSCHFLPAEIYFAADWLPRFDVPEGPPGWSHGQARSLMEEFLDASPHFTPVDVADLAPGDLLGFRIGHAVHHLAIALEGGRIVHAIQRHGVVVAPCIPTPWLTRLRRAWRPNLPAAS